MMDLHPSDLVLIALLPRPLDLERARAGSYRVPLAHAPTALAGARALAFYQPASFGEARWQVAWWARIAALQRLPRRELIPEEPDHPRADAPYISVALDALHPFDPPRRSTRGRRLLFVPTTWGALQQTTDLDEIMARPPRPIADDPLYALIRQQVASLQGIPDPNATHQRRLLDTTEDYAELLNW